MAGCDLGSAVCRDVRKHKETGKRRDLGWYARGRVVLACVARGLAYLHGMQVKDVTRV